ncbi:cytochrome oxidase putative small subunit CydP [Cupriavidus sp. amp6]|uniref:cytochrome oxidase putative small subunit CydP n=1 Tax=Cupriavidus sp. amp6 TaxID=388051 RepID=UPI00041635AC|nr:cytochrome oxidase putative small subunit CydP [Cupriavidus sp. amp6]
MNASDQNLLRHLGWVLAIKLLLLLGLWLAFIAGQRVPVDAVSASAHLRAAPTVSGNLRLQGARP